LRTSEIGLPPGFIATELAIWMRRAGSSGSALITCARRSASIAGSASAERTRIVAPVNVGNDICLFERSLASACRKR